MCRGAMGSVAGSIEQRQESDEGGVQCGSSSFTTCWEAACFCRCLKFVSARFLRVPLCAQKKNRIVVLKWNMLGL